MDVLNEDRRNRKPKRGGGHQNRSQQKQKQHNIPKKYYLLSWPKPLDRGFMGCIIDSNGILIDTIHNLFSKGIPTQEFTRKCKTYSISGKTRGWGTDQFLIKGEFTSPKQAIDEFKSNFKMSAVK